MAKITVDTAQAVFIDGRVLYQSTSPYTIADTFENYTIATALDTANLVSVTEAFTANASPDYTVAIGQANADNTMDSSAVVANADGSVLERQEFIQSKIGVPVNTGGTATLGAVIGDVANSTIAARLTAMKTVVDAISGYVDTEVSSIKTKTDLIGTPTNTGGTADLASILGDPKNVPLADTAMEGCLKVTIADGTTIPNNNQAVAGLLGTATGGDILIEQIIVQRGATSMVGPTNYRISTDNVAGLTGKAAPQVTFLLAKFNASLTSIATIDGTTKQLPFVLESTKKLYIDGDTAATSAGGTTNFYIKYKRLANGAKLV